jgi:hypothetical protein
MGQNQSAPGGGPPSGDPKKKDQVQALQLQCLCATMGPSEQAPGSAGEEEEVGAPSTSPTRGEEAEEAGRSQRPGQQAAHGHSQRQMQAPVTQDGAHQGLPAHGAGVCPEPGAAEA